MDMQMGQLPLSNAAIMDANPISPVWLGGWTPASFDARGVIFACAPGTASGGFAASVIFKTSAGPVGATCPVNLGSVQISIAPSPATSLLLTPLLLSRRRRAPHKD